MDAVFPLVKKYGGVVVALTLDENGIPDERTAGSPLPDGFMQKRLPTVLRPRTSSSTAWP